MKQKLLTLLFVFCSLQGFAQERTVTGTIYDSEGTPLSGASVAIKGTNTGTQSSGDGRYSINVESGKVLVFSYIGMVTAERTVEQSNVINVTLETTTSDLDEVVVVGYGTTTKEAFVGTAKVVKAEVLEAKSYANVSQALAGEVAGVNVINTSGQPGTTSTIRIRGFGSVNGNRAPLYVVDGVPFNGSINSINPADILTATVLKDATATAIYGARGANGVIVITTRTGSVQSNVEVDLKSGINASLLPRNEVIRSPEEYISFVWEGMYNRGVNTGQADPATYASNRLFGSGGIDPGYNMWNVSGADLIDPLTRQVVPGASRRYDPENWEEYSIRSGYRNEGSARFSGGSDKSRHYTSLGYLDEEGYIVGSNYKRYSARSNINHDVTNWLTMTTNIGYAGSQTNNNGQTSDSGNVFWFVDNIPAIFPLFLRDEDGERIPDPFFGGYEYDYGRSPNRTFANSTNGVAAANHDKRYTRRHELNGNFAANIKFTDYLNFETRYGAQYYNNSYTDFRNMFYGWASGERQGFSSKTNTEYFSQNFLKMLRFDKTFGVHSLEVLAAHENNDWKERIIYASKEKAAHPFVDDLDNYIISSSQPGSYTNEASIESYFSQANYNYDGKYYLSGSIRRDGSSRFVNNKWGTFGSIGGSWIVSRENFLAGNDVLSYLKVKTSYGLIGEQAGVGLYPGHNTFVVENLNDELSIRPDANGNPDLSWETSKMFQAGLEMSFGRYLDVNLDYYVKNTNGLLFDRRVGPSQGIAIITVNDGQLLNKGLEFDLTAHLFNTQDFKLDFAVNGEFLTNKIKRMPIEPATGLPKIIDTSTGFGMAEGRSIFDYYMREWAGVDPADGRAMWYQYYNDVNGNGLFDAGDVAINDMVNYLDANPDAVVEKTVTKIYSDATQKYVGKSAIPDVRGAFRLGGKYKSIDFSLQFLYSLGGYSYDGHYASLMGNPVAGGNNWHVDIRDRWQQPGDITDVPRLTDNYSQNVVDVNGVGKAWNDGQANATSTRFLKKADYLSFNNFRLGYTLPEKLLERTPLSNVNIWASGDNLMLLSSRKGFNPSTNEAGESSMYRYLPISTFTFGLRVKFQ